MRELLEGAVPNPAAALSVGLLVAFILFGNSGAVRSRGNTALACLLLLAVLLLRVMDFGQKGRGTAPALFTLIFLATAGYAVWSFALSRSPGASCGQRLRNA